MPSTLHGRMHMWPMGPRHHGLYGRIRPSADERAGPTRRLTRPASRSHWDDPLAVLKHQALRPPIEGVRKPFASGLHFLPSVTKRRLTLHPNTEVTFVRTLLLPATSLQTTSRLLNH